MNVWGKPDPRQRRYLSPVGIIWQSGEPSAPRNSESLLRDDPGQAVLGAEDLCTLANQGGKSADLLLDFGREIHGGVQIITGNTLDNKPVTVHVRFGESAGEAMGAPDNDHAMHDLMVPLSWLGCAEVGNTGFRFVRIEVVGENAWVEIKAVRAVLLWRDLEYQGDFECNDELLNRIWRTGAYTVHLCMQDFLWDGIKRDRLVWIGDMHPEASVVATVFGGHPIVPASLDLIRDATKLPGWMNGISSYSIWWVLIQDFWYARNGDMEYLRRQRSYLLGLMDLLRSRVGEDGREALDGMRFLDWPSWGNEAAIHAGLHALLAMAMDAGARLCDYLGENAAAGQCLETRKRIGRYVPAVGNSKQANALAVLAGLADATEVNRRVLAVDPYSRLSTFYGYYVLEARAAAGDYAGCLAVIRKYWGAMLDLGATTFWEDFNLDWTPGAAGIDRLVPEGMKDIHGDFGDHCYRGFRHSLCHGWSAGPTAWLSEHVLGIRPVQPGFAEVRVEPNLAGLEWACGAVPTPHGLLRVRHVRTATGGVDSTIDLPHGVRRI